MERWGLAGAEKGELRNEPAISHAVIKNYRVTPVRIRADSTQFSKQRANERRRNSCITAFIPDTKGVIHCLDDIVRAYIDIFIRGRDTAADQRDVVRIANSVESQRWQARGLRRYGFRKSE